MRMYESPPQAPACGDAIIFDFLGGFGCDTGIILRAFAHERAGGVGLNVITIAKDFQDDAPRLKEGLLEVGIPDGALRAAEFSPGETFLFDKGVVPDDLPERVARGDADVAWVARLVDPQQLVSVRGSEASRLPSASRAIFALSVLHAWPYASRERLYDFCLRQLRAAAGRTKGTIYVYCVGGLAGGTCSGLLLPSAILWRHLARREGLRVVCRAFLVAGDYRGRDGQQDQREAMSANMLAELEKTTAPDIRYELPVGPGETLEARGPLFDSVVVNEAAGKVAGDTRAVVNIAARTLYFTHFEEAGVAVTKNATNAEDRPRVLALTGGAEGGAARSDLHKFFLGGSRATEFGVAADLPRTVALAKLLEALAPDSGAERGRALADAVMAEAGERARDLGRGFARLKARLVEEIHSSVAAGDPSHPRFDERITQTLERMRVEATEADAAEGVRAREVAARAVGRLAALPLLDAQEGAAAVRGRMELGVSAGEERAAGLREELDAAESALSAAPRPRREGGPQPAAARLGPGPEVTAPVGAGAAASLAVMLLLWLGNDSFGAAGLGLAAAMGCAAAYAARLVGRRQKASPAPEPQRQGPRTARFAAAADRYRHALRSVWELRCDVAGAEAEASFARELLLAFDELTAGSDVSPAARAALAEARRLLARQWEATPERPLVRLHPGAVVIGGRAGSRVARRLAGGAAPRSLRERELLDGFAAAHGRSLAEALNADPPELLAESLVAAGAQAEAAPPLDVMLGAALAEDPRLVEEVGSCIAELRDVAVEGLRLRRVPDPAVCWHTLNVFVPQKAAALLTPLIESRLPGVSVTPSHGLRSVVVLAAARNMPLSALADHERLREAAARVGDAERRATIEYPAALRTRARRPRLKAERNNGSGGGARPSDAARANGHAPAASKSGG